MQHLNNTIFYKSIAGKILIGTALTTILPIFSPFLPQGGTPQYIIQNLFL